MSAALSRLAILLTACSLSSALPSSYPNTEGQPDGDYSPSWQSYFRVTDDLPGINFDLPTNYAGSIDVQREGHPNNTLFFWGFEKSPGSLTKRRRRDRNDPWGIWLNGGPGSSSMVGLFLENGPFKVNPWDNSISENPYSWTNVADFFWIDQPVGVGFSTADADGYVADEDELGRDFMGFLANLVKVFPQLATRPLVISGESYAGVYIPYILKTYLAMPNPPVRISKVAIGDGTLNEDQISALISGLSVIQTFPQLIGYDPEVFSYFKEQHELCHYNITLQYPQPEPLPYIPLVLASARDIPFMTQLRASHLVLREIRKRFAALEPEAKREIEARRAEPGLGKRDLSLRANGTLDPWYGCDFLDEFIDYAINYTYPWNDVHNFDVYDVPDVLGYPNAEQGWNFEALMNDPAWRQALHAPTSKDWSQGFAYTFGELGYEDPSPKPIAFLSELVQNAIDADIGVALYAANNDALIAHRGLDITIQNITWGGERGFTRKPATPFTDDNGKFAGIIHQERGVTYALFDDASHLVPMSKPAAALTFARDFLFGSSRLGLVWGNHVIGGEDPDLQHDILRGGDELYLGNGATQSTYVYPSETIAAWNSFIATASAV